MHYANGRTALVGDPVVGRVYNRVDIVAGTLKRLDPKTNTCNCVVCWPVVGGVSEDFSQCDYLYHAEDAYSAIRVPVTPANAA